MINQPFKLNFDDPTTIYQKIFADRNEEALMETLKARVKDPLWFLVRQWQTGEFLAESCGHPVSVELSYKELPVTAVRHRDNSREEYEPEKPMEWYIEQEQAGGTKKPLDWDERRLEYHCDLEGGGLKLHADEYSSGQLDWYDFTLAGEPDFRAAEVKTLRLIPTNATYPGMPAFRYWTFEDANVNFKSLTRPNENVLTPMILAFSLLSGEDWYIIPLVQKTGTVRKIVSLKVKDNFGQTSPILPVKDDTSDQSQWSMFTLSPANGSSPDASLFFLPTTISYLLEGEDLEEVTFIRDEMMNLVWAVENRYENSDDGTSVDRNDELAAAHPPEASTEATSTLPVYVEMADVPENWIPYFPVELQNGSGPAEIALRQGTVPAAPEPKGKILQESQVINEEEIPGFPISIVRKYNLVNLGREEKWEPREVDGTWTIVRTDPGQDRVLVWCPREKKVGNKTPGRDLKFDQVITKE